MCMEWVKLAFLVEHYHIKNTIRSLNDTGIRMSSLLCQITKIRRHLSSFWKEGRKWFWSTPTNTRKALRDWCPVHLLLFCSLLIWKIANRKQQKPDSGCSLYFKNHTTSRVVCVIIIYMTRRASNKAITSTENMNLKFVNGLLIEN